VQTGIRRDGWIEITSGVSADEQVVVAGLQPLRDGIAVQISEDSP
jgi:multidrug efflux pump subunit AcrA (membrane-fusion protein)